MNLINRNDEIISTTKHYTFYQKHSLQILIMLSIFLPLVLLYFFSNRSKIAKWYLSYYLLDEASQNSIIDLQNNLAQKQINDLKQQLNNDVVTPIIIKSTDVSDTSSTNWKSIAFCTCMITVLIISVGVYTEVIHLEKILDLNFKGVNESLSSEFVNLHDSIGKGITRVNDMNNTQNTDLKGAFKILSNKIDILLNISKMSPEVNQSKSIKDLPDLGDFSS